MSTPADFTTQVAATEFENNIEDAIRKAVAAGVSADNMYVTLQSYCFSMISQIYFHRYQQNPTDGLKGESNDSNT